MVQRYKKNLEKTLPVAIFFVPLRRDYVNRMKPLLLRVLLVLALWAAVPSLAESQTLGTRQYTESDPLIYEDAWDLWPYVFLNERGEPEGFNIDMLKIVFNELKIPYVVKLKPSADALNDLKEGLSDLMLGMDAGFHDGYARYGHEVIQLFTHSVLSPKSAPTHIKTFEDLGRDSLKVIVHTGSFSHHMMVDHGWASHCLPYDDMKEAIQKVSVENHGEIVWNTLSLKWLMNKFKVTNLQMTPVDIQHGEYKFMSNDTVLLQKLDSVYTLLHSSERMDPILNKWFYPERVDSGIPEWIGYLAAVLGVFAFLLLYYGVVLRYRERQMTRLIAKHNGRLALILRTTKVRVWLYDVARETVTWMNTNGEMDTREYMLSDYSYIYSPETFLQMKEAINQIAAGKCEKLTVDLEALEAYGHRDNIVTLSVFRRSKKGVPTVIVGIMADQTERHQHRRQAKDNMLRYQSIFSSSMVDMTYYDAEGVLADVNQKVCDTFHCSRQDLLAERIPFTDALEDSGLTIQDFEGSYTTHLLKANSKTVMAQAVDFVHDFYYEQQLTPVYDADHRFLGIFGSGRDVTEFVESYHQLKLSIKKMVRAAQDVSDYINNINFALHAGGVRIATYTPETHLLTIFKEMNVVQVKLTQVRCMSLLDEPSKRVARRMFKNMDLLTDDTIDVDIKTNIKLPGDSNLTLQFHFFPVRNEVGGIDHYFGLCRDVSQETATAEQLERERLKAQEVESVKNAFLHNMSYEIRTPISTVVGFAELFVKDHDVVDEDNFIKEIKSNASYLLKLVNDILFLSRLDAHMIEFRKSSIDFSQIFEGHCQMGWGKSVKPGVDYIAENPYEHLVLEIDESNVGHIIEQIAECTSLHTDTGRVKARYDYIGDRLLITFDDTGRGIGTEEQKSMFERFNTMMGNNSTGLGLPICKELATQMGGDIIVNSAEGCGTTIWVVIPCQATLIEKKPITV